MAGDVQTKPVEDLGHRVDDAISVGEDLQFQEKWWKFENLVWSFFALLLVLDLLGVFGRGWLAKAEMTAADNSIHVKYERIERTMTPSVLRVEFGPTAAQDGKFKLYVSKSLIQVLGNARVAPQPETSEIGTDGYTYTFPAGSLPASVNFSLEPTGPGVYHFTIGVPGRAMIERRVVVVP